MSKVTVLLPLFNCEKRIKYTLNSLLNQTYDNFQLLLIDDGSVDNTAYIAKQYYKKFKEFTIIEKSKNSGIADSLNIGLKEAKNEIIIRHDAEDISHKERIRILLSFYQKNPLISCIGSSCFLLNNDYTFVGIVPVVKIKNVDFLLDHNINRIYHASAIYNKFHVLEAGGYPDLRASQDYALWKAMRQMGMKFKFLNKPLYAFFRENKGISDLANNEMQLLNRFKVEGKQLSIEEIKKIQYKQIIRNNVIYNINIPSEIIFKNDSIRPYILYYKALRYINKMNMFYNKKYIHGFNYK
jgi:glycosyltransferase EpsE